VIGSHNKPPPPSNDKVFIAEENGEPETPLKDGRAGPGGKEPIVGKVGSEATGGEPNDGEPNGGTLDVGAAAGMGDNPDFSLENSTGSIPEGTGAPEAAAAAIISAGVGSKVPVIVL
jgi:hypothetical protein